MDLLKRILPKLLFIVALTVLLKTLFLGAYPDFNAYYYGSMENNIPNYPPIVTVLFSIFSFLPLSVASEVWIALSIVFLFVSLYLCFKLFNVRFLSSTGLVLSSLVFICFPVKFTLGMGQLNILVLMFVVLTFYFYIKGKNFYSGACLGICIMLKLFPILLLLYFLLIKRRKIFSYAILTSVSLIGVSYLFIKPEINNYYWLHLFLFFNHVPAEYYNQALSGFLMRQFDNPFLRELLRVGISIFFIVLSFWAILSKNKKDFFKTALGFGLIVGLNVFVNGYSWQHHFVWLILPFLVTFFYIAHKKLNSKYYTFLGISYILVSINLKIPSMVPVIFQSHVFFGAIILWVLDAYLLLRK